MEPTARGALLWSRAVLVALVALVTGAVGHVSAEGLLPSFPALLGLLAAGAILAAPALTRPATTRRLVLLLMGGQALVHLALSAAAGHRGDPAGGNAGSAGGAGHAHAVLPVEDGRRVGSLLDSYRAAGHAPADVEPTLPVGGLLAEVAAHAPMTAAHLAAAAAVGVWLGVGERSLWTLLALARRSLLAPLLAAVAVLATLRLPVRIPVSAPPDGTPPPPRSSLLLAATLSRRGPPALLAA
ncbi:hypothetical protein ACFP3Q_11555 [Nocardioides sp. GCM10027113]|uniref:hypothetical protein n=1 Tax=unclassified Nocardioides TaxID=2615069 RepID=UPI00362249EC